MSASTGSPRLERLFDICASLVALILLSPVLLILVALVHVRMGRPVFFTQERVGENNRLFKIVKFRTMLTSAKNIKTDAERLTSFGKFLRSSSLDELPELWNVLRGEMSLVGPRPLLVQYLPLYSRVQARRHEVKPGITGWAQVNGRNAISWDEKFKLDVWYVDNRTLWLDLKILALTAWKILKREGISTKGEATMPFFSGSSKDKNLASDK